jgi:hypothetical protein
MATRKLLPIHPGEVLLNDFLEPLGLSQYRAAPPHQRDRSRHASDHGRYGPSRGRSNERDAESAQIRWPRIGQRVR